MPLSKFFPDNKLLYISLSKKLKIGEKIKLDIYY